jgi:hypothetical protein
VTRQQVLAQCPGVGLGRDQLLDRWKVHDLMNQHVGALRKSDQVLRRPRVA